MDENSAGATLAWLTYEPIHDVKMLRPAPAETFQEAVRFLQRPYGRGDVPLGEVQRLRRGKDK